MKRADKIVEKMRNQPNGVRFEEAEYVLVSYGFEFKRQKGSHRHYINQSGYVQTLPYEDPVKRVYIKQIIDLVDTQ